MQHGSKPQHGYNSTMPIKSTIFTNLESSDSEQRIRDHPFAHFTARHNVELMKKKLKGTFNLQKVNFTIEGNNS